MGAARLLLNRALRRRGKAEGRPSGDPSAAERLRLLLEDTLVTLGPENEDVREPADPDASGTRRRRRRRRDRAD